MDGMTVIDDDPVTPEAMAGVFRDAHDLGRPVQVFTLAVQPRQSVDSATLQAIRLLSARKDIETATGSITVLMSGETAGVVVAQPLGAPILKELGDELATRVAEALGNGCQVSVGLATTREHPGLELDDAIAVAMEGLEVASASGSNIAVHSELYELTLATRRRLGTVFPLESVQDLEEIGGTHEPETRTSSEPASSEAISIGEIPAEYEVPTQETSDDSAGALHAEDDPFA
ncbi:MAG: hypothetical protein AAGG01_22840, partial [Planctomycetota bacterium]